MSVSSVPGNSAAALKSSTVNRRPDSRWFDLDAEEVLSMLLASSEGLSTDDARRRLQDEGPNVLTEAPGRGILRMLVAQLTDVMVLMLIASAAVSAFLGATHDVAAILAIVALDATLGVVQEYRAERAVAALKSMSAPESRVRRDGATRVIPSSELVTGDIVLLEAGGIVPADLRLHDISRLRIEEAALTGESQPVEKTTKTIASGDVSVGDRINMAFKGTVVTYGRGAGIVVATGMRTELGRIATLLDDGDGDRRTPLQARLARFGKNLAFIVLGLCAIVLAAGLARGEPRALMFMTAISLAVAAVPEALPAVVNVALAMGARAMVRQRALIRRLPAVETLGSVTWICSDKTGTLTENRMRVEEVWTGQSFGPPFDESDDVVLTLLFRAIALNNDAAMGVDGVLAGDPTETALHRAASEAGHQKETLEAQAPRVAEVPFSSERARMTTIHRTGRSVIGYTKGAPERVLPHCVDRIGPRGVEAFDREEVLRAATKMATSGLRVLAVAVRRVDDMPAEVESMESQQSFVGLVGLMDPPRAEVRDAVALCQSAGIRVAMITGDHPATARAVAERLGIVSPGGVVVTGAELRAMSDAVLDARVRDLRVYARVAPEDKIRIVAALQRCGESVAMTGDGVNDAPALRRADIGVAMGRSGTDVAREAAQMVLLDDDFATIVRAVREGRRIYDNIRRFVRYELSTNSGEVWTLVLAPVFGLPLPLLPLHILWMNLVTDGLPGLALTAEPPERDIMARSPRPRSESIFAHGLWQHAAWVGLLMAALALGTMAWSIHIGDAHWQSMIFTVLTLSQLAHVIAIRSERESIFTLGLRSNRPLLATVLLTVALQMAVLYAPPLARVFRTSPLSVAELSACAGISSLVFVAVEVEKWLIRRGWLYRNRAASA